MCACVTNTGSQPPTWIAAHVQDVLKFYEIADILAPAKIDQQHHNILASARFQQESSVAESCFVKYSAKWTKSLCVCHMCVYVLGLQIEFLLLFIDNKTLFPPVCISMYINVCVPVGVCTCRGCVWSALLDPGNNRRLSRSHH